MSAAVSLPTGARIFSSPLFVDTPVIFGPHVENFREIAEETLAERAGFMVQDGKTLFEKMRLVLTDASLRADLVEAGRRVVGRQRGAMEKSVVLLLNTIEHSNKR